MGLDVMMDIIASLHGSAVGWSIPLLLSQVHLPLTKLCSPTKKQPAIPPRGHPNPHNRPEGDPSRHLALTPPTPRLSRDSDPPPEEKQPWLLQPHP